MGEETVPTWLQPPVNLLQRAIMFSLLFSRLNNVSSLRTPNRTCVLPNKLVVVNILSEDLTEPKFSAEVFELSVMISEDVKNKSPLKLTHL